MDSSNPGFYAELVKNNFNIPISDLEEIKNIIGKEPQISETEFNKTLHFIYLIDQNNIDSPISSRKEFDEKIKKLRKITKYQPSLSNIAKVYRRDILWTEWSKSPYSNTKNQETQEETQKETHNRTQKSTKARMWAMPCRSINTNRMSGCRTQRMLPTTGWDAFPRCNCVCRLS